jgi:hypothetical protein
MNMNVNKFVGVVIPQMVFCLLTGFLVFTATVLALQGSMGAIIWLSMAGIICILQII